MRPPWHFELSSASRLLTDQLGTLDLRGFGADDLPLAISAAGALLQYVRETQKTALPHITRLAVEERGDALHLDAATRRNLEIDVSLSGQDSATLFALLDSTVTPMGSRNLRRWINRPLTDQQELRRRYQALALAGRCAAFRSPARTAARHRRRGAHSLARGAAQRAAARSHRAARFDRGAACLARRPHAHRGAADRRADATSVGEHTDVADLLQRAIAEEPSVVLRDGDVIAAGYDAELDELRRIASHTDEFLLELERRERERSGIPSLKLAYNRVSGFYIEVIRSQADRVPKDYIRRQTVKNAERFITPELKSFEDKVLGAREKSLARERELYEEVLTQLIDRLGVAAGHGRGAGHARLPGGARRTRGAARLDRTDPGGRDAPRDPRRPPSGGRTFHRRRRSCPTTCCSTPRAACSSSPAPTWAARARTCARAR